MSNSQDNIIIDIGSSTFKSGFCGEKLPRSILYIPNNVKNPNHIDFKKKETNTENKNLINNHNHIYNNNLNNNIFNQNNKNYISLSKYPFDNKGQIDDWDGIITILCSILNSVFKINPEDFNVLLTEPPNITEKNRQNLYEIMFEMHSVKSCYIANSCVLSVFAAGKTSGISIDAGEYCTHFIPVYEGLGIRQCLESNLIAGKEINEFLLKLISEKGLNIKLNDNDILDIKEKFSYISFEYESELQSFSSINNNTGCYSDYILPDQTVIKLGTEKFRCPEALFKPGLIGKNNNTIYNNNFKNLSWHEAIQLVMNNLDLKKEDDEEEKIKKELYSNIILSGGTSMFKGLPERLAVEITKLSGLNYCDVIAIPERKYSSWIGGSILSSISVFQSLWITKEDYEEFGKEIINQKII